MNFMDLNLTLWLINRTIENKNNRVDGGFNNGERKNQLEQ